ncbi:hypothetical protein EI94DRAFT_195080 [Lactarius quietus]|nr:hypothetical protein EI94DRAFT_195080 [Lactarius quietus]
MLCAGAQFLQVDCKAVEIFHGRDVNRRRAEQMARRARNTRTPAGLWSPLPQFGIHVLPGPPPCQAYHMRSQFGSLKLKGCSAGIGTSALLVTFPRPWFNSKYQCHESNGMLWARLGASATALPCVVCPSVVPQCGRWLWLLELPVANVQCQIRVGVPMVVTLNFVGVLNL